MQNDLQVVLRASASLDAWHLAMRAAPVVCQAQHTCNTQRRPVATWPTLQNMFSSAARALLLQSHVVYLNRTSKHIMAARTVIGAAGSTLSDRDIARLAHGGDVVLDTAASERLKKDSPPKGDILVSSSVGIAAVENGDAASAWLTAPQTRAVLLARLLPLVNGSSKTRLGVIELVARLLRPDAHLDRLLPIAVEPFAMQRLAAVLPQHVASTAGAIALSTAEQVVVDSGNLTLEEGRALATGQPVAAGLAAVAIAGMRQLLTAASAVTALSAEALQADVRRKVLPESWSHIVADRQFAEADCCLQHDVPTTHEQPGLSCSSLYLLHYSPPCMFR